MPTLGKVLPVRIITPPLVTVSVQFVVEDPRGATVPVQLFHVPTTDQHHLADWFPVGATFGVKEPLFRSLADGSYYLRIETPRDFIRLWPSSPVLANVHFPPQTAHWLDSVMAAGGPLALKEAGDKAFTQRRYVRAKEAYEFALDAVRDRHHPDEHEHEGRDRERAQLVIKIYANLSQTLLYLELPELARRAAHSGLVALAEQSESEYEPLSSRSALFVKLAYREALALYRLGQYDRALVLCERIRAPGSTDSNLNLLGDDVPALLARIRLRILETEQGPSDETLRSLWTSSVVKRNARRPPPPPPLDLADWVDSSAIEIVPVPGKGLGLVARKPLKRGHLVLCCKPLAYAGGGGGGSGGSGGSGVHGGNRKEEEEESKKRRLRYTVGVNLWTRSEDPWAVREVVSQVLWRAALDEGEGSSLAGGADDEGGWRKAVAPLWAGKEDTDGDLARGGDGDRASSSSAGDALAPSRVEAVVTFNGFHLEQVTASSAAVDSPDPGPSCSTSSSSDEDGELFHAPTALYPSFPSALNHSCLSNCTYTFLSSVFLLRVRVDIAAGQELVDSYVDASAPLEAREHKLGNAHGFTCECAICAEERRVGVEVRQRRAELGRRAEAEANSIHEGEAAGRLRRTVAELEATYSETTRIRPAMYTPLRLLSQALQALGPASAGPDPSNLDPEMDAIANELRALEALGARFAGPRGAEELVEPPRLRDMDGVMSALWIAKEWQRRGKPEQCRHWISLARSIEAGQAGEALFELRYGDWARKNGLDLGR
ncbi:hypothetical protein JCM3774_005461 [Rhodotorula dairenensis]